MAKLSVIIPTYNEEKYLPYLLEDLSNQTIKDFEIIISDAGSKDKTRQISQKYNTRLVNGGHPSKGRNSGAKIACSELLLFLDADIRLHENFLEGIIQKTLSNNLDLSSAYIRHAGNYVLVSKFTNWLKKNGKTKVLSAQSLLIKKSHFEKLTGFDENLHIGEDVEFGKRAAAAGLNYGFIDEEIMVSNRRLEKMGFVKLILSGMILLIWGQVNPDHFLKNQTKVVKYYGGWDY
ncbi:glycosyltransferase [Candidatus Microgenomates bacterium]|nr:glycosyltransferase [Candidatus Microgenomates bacterium]